MKTLGKILFFLLKWALVLVVGVELLAFAIVAVSNFVIYGHIREGSRAVYDPYTLFRSSEGVRDTVNVCHQPDRQTRLIWLFGGSTARGSTEDDAKTIASLLVQELNRTSSDICWDVVNFGENSYNSLLEVQYFQKQLIKSDRRPDIVLFYDGANDSVYFAQHRTTEGHHGYRRARGLIESYYKSFFGVFKALNAAFYASFTKELYDKFTQVQVPVEPDDPKLEQHAREVLERYNFVNKVSACYGAHFLVFWQPAQWVETDEVMVEVREKESKHFINTERFASMRENFLTVYGALEQTLEQRPYFVDFRNVLASRKEVAFKPDGVHLTDYGRQMVAKAMVERLRQRGLL